MIISEELKQAVSKEIRLQMAVKAVNDTAGYNGLVPTLLVFDTFPRITNEDVPTLSTIKRAKAINSAMTEVAKLHAKRQVSDALHQRNGPQGETTNDRYPMPAAIICRRVTRSVLASELYALSLGFDVAATIKSTLDQMFSDTTQGKIPLSMCIDSRSLYECLVKLDTT